MQSRLIDLEDHGVARIYGNVLEIMTPADPYNHMPAQSVTVHGADILEALANALLAAVEDQRRREASSRADSDELPF